MINVPVKTCLLSRKSKDPTLHTIPKQQHTKKDMYTGECTDNQVCKLFPLIGGQLLEEC